eukprot:5903919-Pleurochrysis_carterae.AAC.1
MPYSNHTITKRKEAVRAASRLCAAWRQQHASQTTIGSTLKVTNSCTWHAHPNPYTLCGCNACWLRARANFR